MGITNIIFITIYQEDYGINYHSLPLKGKPQPPANILSDPPAYIPAYIQTSISQQHHIFHYRNCHAQTALHELVDNHVFLTSVRCKWHSNPNFWGEMEWKGLCVCVHTCLCQSSQVFGRVCLCIRHACTECQAFEGSLASMLYWSNVLFLLDTLKPCYLQTLSIIKASAKSPVLQVALVAKQAFSRTFFVAKIGEQMAWWKWCLSQRVNSPGPS